MTESTQTTLASVVYVSALYDISGHRRLDEYLQFFTPLAKTSMEFILFTDKAASVKPLKSHKNVKIVVLPKSEIDSFSLTDVQLPEYRNKEKDTLEYLQLANAKAQFIQEATKHKSADCYIWVDADLLHVTRRPEYFINRLEKLPASLVPNKVLIPGCVAKQQIQFEQLFKSPIWRFCGGLILVPKGCVDRFAEAHKTQLAKCKTLCKLTWEVNLWAVMEQENPDLFYWYSADHNDSMVNAPRPGATKRVMLVSMIKNESRIIKRLLSSVLNIVDAICISDTGSTDNTVEILEEYYKTLTIPCKTYQHIWKDFGHNRSLSFDDGVDFCKQLGWDLEDTYGLLLDADMELRPLPGFSKSMLTSIGYKIIQRSGNLEYYNTRFVKLGHSWKCVGVTHEYWDGGNTDTLTPDVIYIQDVGDGGCKADKFERDVRLLEQGLIDSPNNPRYLFYLAQSYKDNKQIDKGIEYYKKRIDAGGWHEEIWYSMYTLMKLYCEKKQFADMEYWGLKAYEFHNKRAENILYLCRYFRDNRQHFKAWQYYLLGSGIKKPDDLLFIETDCYEKGFEYERSILHDYIFPEKKQDSLNYAIDYFNKWGEHFAYMNIEWFVQPLKSSIRILRFEDIGDFVATSTCLAKQKDVYQVNVRYVNYRIQPDGSYIMMQDGILSRDHAVRTENYTCVMDNEFNIISPLIKMEMKDTPPRETHIRGLEDVRIFNRNGALWYTATTMNYSYDGKIRQHYGIYNTTSHQFEQSVSLRPPMETECEKNWIPYKENQFIYGYNPFRIGHLDKDNKLVLDIVQETPKLLSHMRGSSTLVYEGGYAWGITHCVIYKQPRKYYHMVIKIDLETDKIVGYTSPFYFVSNNIEYCLGFEKQGDKCVAIVSRNDRNPVLVEFSAKDLVWHTV